MSEYLGVPPYNRIDINDWCLYARNTINGVLNGKTNNTGSVTLRSSTSSTTVTLAIGRLGVDTVILLQPTTSAAAASLSTTWVSTKDSATGKFVLTHANTGGGDRTFNFILVG